MSYCRFGEDSDVYIVCDGTFYNVYIGNGKGKKYKTLKGLKKYICKLKNSGYKIPNRAFERIEKEIFEPMKNN